MKLAPEELKRIFFDLVADEILAGKPADIDVEAMISEFRDIMIDREIRSPGSVTVDSEVFIKAGHIALPTGEFVKPWFIPHEISDEGRTRRLFREALCRHNPVAWGVTAGGLGDFSREPRTWRVSAQAITAHDRLRVMRKYPKRLPPETEVR